MTNRLVAPSEAPCWVDLWTSDVEGSRPFYAELSGWQAAEPSPGHGGYIMFARASSPVAGAMGAMGEVGADNTWRPFFATEDMERTLRLAAAHGATVHLPNMAIDDLGVQAVIAGIGDELESLAPGRPPHWSVSWPSDDVDASVAKLSALGRAVLTEAADHGLGRAALVADPSGAGFWLFRPKG